MKDDLVLKELEELRVKVEKCRKCPLSSTRKRVVFGEGEVEMRVMIVGEAPGREEDEQGRPFVGRAGKLLSELLSSIGVERRRIYITNVVKCRPPGNRPPRKSEVEACMEYLSRQFELLKPRIVILLGGVALKAVLGESGSLTSIRGKPIMRGGVAFLPTLHPASVLYNPRNRKLIEEDMKKFKELLENAA